MKQMKKYRRVQLRKWKPAETLLRIIAEILRIITYQELRMEVG